MRSNNNTSMNSNSNFNSNSNNPGMTYGSNSNMQNITPNNEVYFNNMIRMQNIQNYNSPLRPINENLVMNNFPNTNSNPRNNINQHQSINMQNSINKNSYLNNPNINMIGNYGNVAAQMSNINNQQSRMNSNVNNQQFVNFMSIPIIEGNNNNNAKGFNYQMNNVNVKNLLFFLQNLKKTITNKFINFNLINYLNLIFLNVKLISSKN